MATPPPAPAKSGWLNARWHNIPHWALVGGAGALIIGIYVLKKRAAAASSSTVGGAGGTLPSDLSGYGYGAGGAPGGIGGGIGTPTGVGLPAGGLITGSIPPNQPPAQQAATPTGDTGALFAISPSGQRVTPPAGFDWAQIATTGVGGPPPGPPGSGNGPLGPGTGGWVLSPAAFDQSLRGWTIDPVSNTPRPAYENTPAYGAGSALVAHR